MTKTLSQHNSGNVIQQCPSMFLSTGWTTFAKLKRLGQRKPSDPMSIKLEWIRLDSPCSEEQTCKYLRVLGVSTGTYTVSAVTILAPASLVFPAG